MLILLPEQLEFHCHYSNILNDFIKLMHPARGYSALVHHNIYAGGSAAVAYGLFIFLGTLDRFAKTGW
jgi:hypothetical protein